MLTWPVPTTASEVRGFLGVCNHLRMFIRDFSEVTAPLRRLTRKGVEFEWGEEEQLAFEKVEEIVKRDIVLRNVEYGPGAGFLKLAINASYIDAEAVLTEEDGDGMDKPVLNKIDFFSPVESRYSQPKLELCEVAKTLKKLQVSLWGQEFEFQVDSKSLIQMIKTPDLPNAPVNRRVPFVQLFNFTLIHKSGKTFTMAEGLSRRPRNADSEEEGENFDEELKHVKPVDYQD